MIREFARRLRTLRAAGSSVAALAALGAAFAVPALAGGQTAEPQRSADANVIDGRYIVVYENSVDRPGAATANRERALGFRATHVYGAALDGFAAKLTDAQVRALERDPKVDFVDEDRLATTADWVPRVPGEPGSPTGIRRTDAARGPNVREASQTGVAVIDSGVRLNHSDLNAVDGKDCVDPGTPADDGNGHGTHVAGTIGGRNNGRGVTGIAPNTEIHAVRVLNNAGTGSFAQIICGINWVKNQAAARDIGVANMSLGGGGSPVQPCATTTDAMHKAICRATNNNNRIDFVVAAGNDGWDFDFPAIPDVPAAYPQVLTVTAMADSDGRKGGNGPSTGCSWVVPDETPAPFSNFALTAEGEAHTIAGPGVCIKSTWIGSPNYNTISGTSMASPHVAGMVALCIGEVGHAAGPCASKSTKGVINTMRNYAESFNTKQMDYGFEGDPLHSPGSEYYGFLARTRPPLP